MGSGRGFWWLPGEGLIGVGNQRQLQGEGGPHVRSGTKEIKGAPHIFGHERAAVQSKSMTAFTSGETLGKNARKIFRGDAHAIVHHAN